jgi:hypothetical protein
VEAATDKVNRHLEVVHADWAMPSSNPILQIQRLTREELFKYYEANIDVVRQSRERLRAVISEIQQILNADTRS